MRSHPAFLSASSCKLWSCLDVLVRE
jgi:hypothetical protein